MEEFLFRQQVYESNLILIDELNADTQDTAVYAPN